ncbi:MULTISPECIES: C40 family peptidase [unclassified Streptomyces]|uniref:C40 family peptidase n=1 Tax=unclassified Streptomyces TaxID=2593676 RepID=UPI000DD6495E|nr:MULTISPECIES: C40 family peptidase [unclassified Streptomyces]QZZ29516.1 C40 family peptidase [Streptomyces sp. ST1015]
MEELLIPVGLMSHTAHIRSHRKPRRNASSIAVRAGVASGVLGTLAVATAAGSANAADATVTQTLELPTLTADLSAQVEQAAQFTQQAAANYQLQAERDSAAAAAAKEAAQDLAAAKQAEAKKKADEEARKAAAEAAVSRSETRASLSSGSSSSDSVATPASGSVATVIDFLKAQVGDAYVLGGTGPNAWDCSGLVQAAFKQVGVDLPRVSEDQSNYGTDVSLSNIQPGDILYWGGKGSAYHVGVYLGAGKYLDAANPSKGVVIQDLSGYPASGAVRVL